MSSGVIHPRKLDGSPIAVYRHMATCRVYVDAHFTNGRASSEYKMQQGRGGPFTPPHHCRMEDYGLADGLVRCRKCGEVGQGVKDAGNGR